MDVNAGLDRERTVDAGKGYGKIAESPDLCGEESALRRQKGPSFLQSCARLRQEWSSVREKSSWAARSTPGATRRRPSRPCRTHDRGLPAPWPGPSAPPARPTVPPAQPASRAARPTTPPAQPPRPPARRARPPTAPRRPAGRERRTPDEARPACRHAEPGLWRGRPALERGKPDPWQPLETRKLTRRNAAPLCPLTLYKPDPPKIGRDLPSPRPGRASEGLHERQFRSHTRHRKKPPRDRSVRGRGLQRGHRRTSIAGSRRGRGRAARRWTVTSSLTVTAENCWFRALGRSTCAANTKRASDPPRSRRHRRRRCLCRDG